MIHAFYLEELMTQVESFHRTYMGQDYRLVSVVNNNGSYTAILASS